jgi:hypothetical protein
MRGAFTSRQARSVIACKETRLPKEPMRWIYLDWRSRNFGVAYLLSARHEITGRGVQQYFPDTSRLGYQPSL